MENINTLISDNLKRLRKEKKMSLDTVSKLSGVSKSMLGQIERNEVNPTLATVWKISNGMKVAFSEFLIEEEEKYDVKSIKNIEPVSENDGHYRTYVIFPFNEESRFEMSYVEIDEGCSMQAEAHPDGSQEYITVFSGKLVMRIDDSDFELSEGMSLRFKADRPHRYENVGNSMCKISMVVLYKAFT